METRKMDQPLLIQMAEEEPTREEASYRMGEARKVTECMKKTEDRFGVSLKAMIVMYKNNV